MFPGNKSDILWLKKSGFLSTSTKLSLYIRPQSSKFDIFCPFKNSCSMLGGRGREGNLPRQWTKKEIIYKSRLTRYFINFLLNLNLVNIRIDEAYNWCETDGEGEGIFVDSEEKRKSLGGRRHPKISWIYWRKENQLFFGQSEICVAVNNEERTLFCYISSRSNRGIFVQLTESSFSADQMEIYTLFHFSALWVLVIIPDCSPDWVL